MDGFDELHRRVNKRAENELVLWAFDLMQLNGNDLRAVALADRKRRLAHLIERAGIARLRHSESFEDGERLLGECDRGGLKGVVAKHEVRPAVRPAPTASAERAQNTPRATEMGELPVIH